MKKKLLVMSLVVVTSFVSTISAKNFSINNTSSYTLHIEGSCFSPRNLNRYETVNIELPGNTRECDVTVTALEAPNKRAKFRFNAREYKHVSKDSSGLDSVKSQNSLAYGIQDLK